MKSVFWAGDITCLASSSASTAILCSYQLMASASSVRDIIGRANGRVSPAVPQPVHATGKMASILLSLKSLPVMFIVGSAGKWLTGVYPVCLWKRYTSGYIPSRVEAGVYPVVYLYRIYRYKRNPPIHVTFQGSSSLDGGKNQNCRDRTARTPTKSN